MRDVREDILARLLEVIAAIPNIKSAQRNSGIDIPDDVLPAAVLFDGDEESAQQAPATPRSNGRVVPFHLVDMSPQIYIAEQADQSASEIDAFRRELIKRVHADATLLALVGANGLIRYDRCEVGLSYGRTLQRALVAQFTFKYPLKIEEL